MTTLRNKESGDNQQAIKDFQVGLEGLEKAINLLLEHSGFSSGGDSFLQVDERTDFKI